MYSNARSDLALHIKTQAAQKYEFTSNDYHAHLKVPYHQIFHNLFLGNYRGFIDYVAQLDGRPSFYPDEPEIKFQKVISIVSVEGILKEHFPDENHPFLQPYIACPIENNKQAIILEERVQEIFKLHAVKWIKIKPVQDHADAWGYLVQHCTHINHSGNGQVEKVFSDLKVSEWFGDIFNEIDDAIFKDKPVFVHCAGGVSRSPSIIIAYLINRFRLSFDEANHFVRLKRMCAVPNQGFATNLAKYAKELQLTTD